MTEKYIKILVGKPEDKRVLVKPWHGWEEVKIYLWEFWCNDVNWVHLAQNALHLWICVKTVMSLQVSLKTKNVLQCLSDCQLLGKKKKTLMCEVSGGKRIIQVFRSSPVIHWSLFDDTLTDRWIYSPISMKWFMNQRWILNVYITLYGIWSVMRKLYTIFVLLKEKQQYAWICSPCTISIFLHVSF